MTEPGQDIEQITLEAELVDEDAEREIAKAVGGRQAMARKYVRWVRRRNPDATPAEIISTLNTECNAIVAEPKLKAQLVSLGTRPKSMTPAEFGKLIVDYTQKWAKVIKFAGVKPS